MGMIFNFHEINGLAIAAILIIIVAVAIILILNWQCFKIEMYKMMLQAKRLAKDEILKSGDDQVEWIVMAAYLLLPKAWTIFLSEQRLRIIIKYLYSKLKKYVENEGLNKN